MCRMFCEHDYCSPNGFCMAHLYFWQGDKSHGGGSGVAPLSRGLQQQAENDAGGAVGEFEF
jgi:hypothetical protein